MNSKNRIVFKHPICGVWYSFNPDGSASRAHDPDGSSEASCYSISDISGEGWKRVEEPAKPEVAEPPCAPGYRWMKEGEAIQHEDQVRLNNGKWRNLECPGKKVDKLDCKHHLTRRPITSDGKDKWFMAPEGLVRLMDAGEVIERGDFYKNSRGVVPWVLYGEKLAEDPHFPSYRPAPVQPVKEAPVEATAKEGARIVWTHPNCEHFWSFAQDGSDSFYQFPNGEPIRTPANLETMGSHGWTRQPAAETPAPQPIDSNVEAVCASIKERSAAGVIEYGDTTDRKDVPLLQWIVEAQNEMKDGAVYLERVKKDVAALMEENVLLKAAVEASQRNCAEAHGYIDHLREQRAAARAELAALKLKLAVVLEASK